jgi:hypothetical protein
MKKMLLIAILSLCVCGVVNAADITGTWEGYFKSNLGYAEVTMDLEQDNGTFSGSWEATSGGYGSISGKIRGKSVKFTIYNEAEDCSGKFSGKGKLSSNGNIISFSFSGKDCEGSWKGKGKIYFQD